MSEIAPITGNRVAFLGGSFDPPHVGHLTIARAAQQALKLDTILFAPVGTQPLKPLGSTASYEDRVAMTELAIAEEPGFCVSRVDAPKPGGAPNYTFDTLHVLRAHMAAGAELFCLMGADSLHGLRRWYHAAEILFTAHLVVASRPGDNLNDLSMLLPQGVSLQSANPVHLGSGNVELLTYAVRNATGTTAPFYVLPGLHVDASATQIRASLHGGFGATPLLLPQVANYIVSHHLYTDG